MRKNPKNGTMKFSLRSLMLVPIIFSIGFLAAASLIVIQAREDIREELISANHVAESLAKLIESNRINAYAAKSLHFRHLRIVDQPPQMLSEHTNYKMTKWLVEFLLVDDITFKQTYPVRLDPVQVWSVYATPEDELNEVWQSIAVTFMVFSSSAILCLLLIQLGINDILKRLRQFNHAIKCIREGDLQNKLPETSPISELKALAAQFNAASSALFCTQEENRALSFSLISSQEQERRRLGSELHDNLGQIISGLRARLYLLRIQTKDVANLSLQDTLESMTIDLEETHRVVRHLISELDPVDLQSMTLQESLSHICSRWQKLTGIKCLTDLSISQETTPALKSLEIVHIVRILQEALHNIQKHANTKEVKVLAVSSDEFFDLRICDQGIGDVHLKPGYGLRSMRERAKELGAELRIQRYDEQGVVVHLHKTFIKRTAHEIFDRR